MKLLFRNRKIKFSEADYIDKHYIDGDNAIIPINLDSVDDLYMKHDFKKLALSDELCKYIEEIAYIIPLKYHIVLEIHSPKIDEQEQMYFHVLFGSILFNNRLCIRDIFK